MLLLELESLREKFINWKFIIDGVERETLVAENIILCDEEEMFLVLRELSGLFDKGFVSFEVITSGKYKILLRKNEKQSKYKRMYTSGCFDIFHFGHLNILKKSKELCDYLIVGVSTDELILKEKGKLPVIPFSERIRLVEAIKYVDQAIPQVDKNKQRIIDEYAIDAISVGDDWLGKFPPTSCPVEYFSYTENVSSTILKDTLKIS